MTETKKLNNCPHCHSRCIEYVAEYKRYRCKTCTSRFTAKGHILDWQEILNETKHHIEETQ